LGSVSAPFPLRVKSYWARVVVCEDEGKFVSWLTGIDLHGRLGETKKQTNKQTTNHRRCAKRATIRTTAWKKDFQNNWSWWPGVSSCCGCICVVFVLGVCM
jgi:hypothetical protein